MNGTDVTLAMARVLLERGADPNTKARLCNLPLTDCVTSNKIDFIKLLLEFGVMHFCLWQYIYSPPPLASFNLRRIFLILLCRQNHFPLEASTVASS
jgi:ankyrin repeat protein